MATTSVPPQSGRRSRRGPWFTLFAGLLFLIITGAAGAGVLENLKSGGFDNPDSDSVAAASALEHSFPESQPNLLVLIKDTKGGVDSSEAHAAADRVVKTIGDDSGARVVASYFDTPDPALRSDEAGLVLVRVNGDENESLKTTKELHEKLSDPDGAVAVSFGGISAVNNDMNEQIEKDIVAAESIAIPLTLLLLIIVFRGVIAALLPLSLAALTVIGSLGILNVFSRFTDVSVFGVNLITALGLGLAVDYSLLIVTRYREERAAGRSDVDALRITRATAGRTVFVSGCVVGAALATLLVFDQYFLRSFAYAGISVVLLAVGGALVLLPPALLLLGDRIDALGWARRTAPKPAADTTWGHIAGLAFRKPVLLSMPVVILLIAIAVPFAHSQFGVPDERVLPKTGESRVVAEVLREDFSTGDEHALNVVARNWKGSDADLAAYATALSRTDKATKVVSAAGVFEKGARVSPLPADQVARFDNGTATWFQVQTDVAPYSSEGSQLARDVRDITPPAGNDVLVGGQAAQVTDINRSIADKLPIALALIVVLSFLFLFLLTGSVVQPIRALLLNLLSLSSILGVTVWVFQDGNFSGVLGFTPSPLAVSMPVLVFCIAFGLSMDYEVFLISRIKELHDRSGDLASSVREGLGASGPVITAAAAILAVSFFAMLTSGVSLIKLYGLATGLAILIDAVLVRGALVPASLRATGRISWWAPSWMGSVYVRFGIRESAEEMAVAPTVPAAGAAGDQHHKDGVRA